MVQKSTDQVRKITGLILKEPETMVNMAVMDVEEKKFIELDVQPKQVAGESSWAFEATCDLEDGRKYLEFILLMNKNSPKYTFFISAIEPNQTSDGKTPQTDVLLSTTIFFDSRQQLYNLPYSYTLLDVFDNRSVFDTVIDTSFQEEYSAHEIEELIAFIFMNDGKEVDLRQ